MTMTLDTLFSNAVGICKRLLTNKSKSPTTHFMAETFFESIFTPLIRCPSDQCLHLCQVVFKSVLKATLIKATVKV